MRKFKVLAVLFVALLLSGCMKYKTEITVNSDGSVDIGYTASISKKVTEDMGSSSENSTTSTESLSEEDKKKLEEKGYKIESYDDGEYMGYVVKKHYNSIDDISTTDEVTASTNLVEDDDSKIFTVKKGFFANTYKAKITMNKEKESYDQVKQYNTDEYAEYFKGLELSYNITLPTKAKANNATSVNNKTYSWDLINFNQDYIEYEFELLNTKNIIMVCCGAALIIAGIAFIIIKKKKTN